MKVCLIGEAKHDSGVGFTQDRTYEVEQPEQFHQDGRPWTGGWIVDDLFYHHEHYILIGEGAECAYLTKGSYWKIVEE